jgi:hypothetical protein
MERHVGNDCIVEARVPRLDFALNEDDLGVRVRGDKFFSETNHRRVGGDGTVMTQHLVPVFKRERLAYPEEFRVERFVPYVAVADRREEAE